MKTHGITFYVIRSLVRFAVVMILMAAVVMGIPLAVQLLWPAIALALVLWTAVAIMYYRTRQSMVASGVE